MPAFIDLTGMSFGRLKVLNKESKNKFNRWVWLCLCSCSSNITVDGQGLRAGSTKSCGCFNSDQKRSICIKRNTKHGASKTKLYRVWTSLRERCNSPNVVSYPRYGGRGIYVHPDWESFERFRDDMGYPPSKKHTIDRIDCNGPYSEENCRWVLQRVQQNNRRNNRLITHNGETRTLQQWVRLTGLPRKTISSRIDRGWPIDKALDFF